MYKNTHFHYLWNTILYATAHICDKSCVTQDPTIIQFQVFQFQSVPRPDALKAEFYDEARVSRVYSISSLRLSCLLKDSRREENVLCQKKMFFANMLIIIVTSQLSQLFEINTSQRPIFILYSRKNAERLRLAHQTS